MRSKRRWVIGLVAVAALVIVALLVVASRIPLSSDTLRKRVVVALAGRLNAEVELQSLTLHFSPRLKAVGTGLTVRYRARHDVPPLLTINSFTVNASLRGLWRRRVDFVQLDGLDIQIPPGMNDDAVKPPAAGNIESTVVARASVPPAVDGGSTTSSSPTATTGTDEPPNMMASYAKQVVIDELEAPNASLTILRRESDKPPRVWYLHSLRMQSVGLESPMPFQSFLTNAVPPGEISIKGSFGPWAREDPGSTPIAGEFTFANADLGVFKGISGILSAEGKLGGTLDQIVVDGQTHTPDFMVTIGGHPVPLETTYHAIVDATNGNTMLEPVNAKFLDTALVARGGVYEIGTRPGREVRLKVTIERGKMQDLMRLAVNTPKPTMTGVLFLSTDFVIPPGKADVIEKLQLRGQFAIDRGRFTDPGVQNKDAELSRRASGKREPLAAPERVESDFKGRFALSRASLTIPSVTFDVPGALVDLAGTYAMRDESLAFAGDLYMDAKISQTMTGFKSLLLKLADPLFRKNGRTVIPLKIGGKRQDPQFGLDMGRVFHRGKDDSPAKPAVAASDSKSKAASADKNAKPASAAAKSPSAVTSPSSNKAPTKARSEKPTVENGPAAKDRPAPTPKPATEVTPPPSPRRASPTVH